MSKIAYWGKHQIVNAHRCGIMYINNYRSIKHFNDSLVKAIDMKPYGEPFIKHFGEGHLSGYTLIQPIHTSCITAHFSETERGAYIDIFSCKDFSETVVRDLIQDLFNPEWIDSKVIDRQCGIQMQ